MRNICLLLLLLNIMVLGYQRWILQPSNMTRAAAQAQDVPLLSLVNPPEDFAGSAPFAAASAAEKCLRLGPFASRDAAQSVQRDLRKRGAEVSQSAADGQVWVGHWVQVDDQGSRASAEKARARLASSDIETYILPGESIHALSLGIYRKRASADRVLKKSRDLGYQTRMVDRFQAGTLFWLQVRMPDNDRLQPGEFQGDAGQILRTESVSC
jgi:cell division septation protein DedD